MGVTGETTSMHYSLLSYTAPPRRRRLVKQAMKLLMVRCSGGMLLNADGVVLGMVTSNVRHTPPPSSDDDMATRKAKEKQSEEGGALLVELNFSMPLVALEHLLSLAGIFEPQVRDTPALVSRFGFQLLWCLTSRLHHCSVSVLWG